MEQGKPKGSGVRGCPANVMRLRQVLLIRLRFDSWRDCHCSCATGGVCPMNLFALPRATRHVRMTGRVLGGVLLAALLSMAAITASAAGPIASSTFAGVENPLSEGGTWVTITSLAPKGSTLQKDNGAFPTGPTGCDADGCNHGGARTTVAVPNDQYSEIVVGHVGSTQSNVGPIVRVQTSGPAMDSHYLWWATQPGGANGFYRIDATGTSYQAFKLIDTSGVVD